MGSLTLAIPPASTTVAGTVQLDTATNSISTTKAATPSAVKTAVDNAAAAQAAAATAQATANGKVSNDNGHDAVGSMVFAYRVGVVAAGATYAGSSLTPGSIYDGGAGAWIGSSSGAALSGTWRALGSFSGTQAFLTIYQRIA